MSHNRHMSDITPLTMASEPCCSSSCACSDVGNEIIKGIQGLNVNSYTQLQTIAEVVDVVKGVTGIK